MELLQQCEMRSAHVHLAGDAQMAPPSNLRTTTKPMSLRIFFVSTAFATMLLSGCATSSVPNFAAFTINAAPGRFQAFQAKIRLPETGVDVSNLRMRFLKLQPSDVWAPVLAVCIEGSGEQAARTCLNLSVSPEGEAFAKQIDQPQGSREPARQPVGGPYRPGDAFMVQVEARESSVGFSLNGSHLFGSTVVKGPAKIEFSCSSAVCSFDLEP